MEMEWIRFWPSAAALVLAVLFVRFPGFAVGIAVLACVGFSVLHSICVAQSIQEELEESRRRPAGSPPTVDRSFRGVVVRMASKTGLLKR
jgi:hypothetical protein